MADEQRDQTGQAEPADTLAPAPGDDLPAATGPERDGSAPDSSAPFTGAIPTPQAAPTPSPTPSPPPSSPATDSAAGSFGTALPGPAVPAPDYSTAGVPSLDYVRDKIEGRYAHSLGASELAEGIPEVRSFEEQAAKREEAARDKLEEIRRSLRGGSPS